SGYGATFTRRATSGPPVMQRQGNAKRSSASLGSGRPSTNGSGNSVHRSPRRSLRSSFAGAPYRRASDNKTKEKKCVKSVQWKDEVGKGNLDDGGVKPTPWEANTPPIVVSATSPDTSVSTPTQRQTSFGGSESDWEDENERTDDSVNSSFMLNGDTPLLATRPY